MLNDDVFFKQHSSFAFAILAIAVFGLLFVTACGSGSSGSPPPPPAPLVLAVPANTNENGINNIWTIHADGSDALQLTQYNGSTSQAQALQPLWSPDGTQMVFASDGALDGSDTLAQYYYLWIMKANGSGRQPLYTNNPIIYSAVGNVADWSSGGTKVAISESFANTFQIAVVNADGSNPTPLADGLAPVWSPDGTKLAFEGFAGSDPDGNIFTVQANGTGLTQLTQFAEPFNAVAPVWSPDGTKLAFSVGNMQGGGYTIWIMNADGSNQTSYPGSSFIYDWGNMIGRIVNWSPDSTKVAFPSTAALDGNPSDPDINSVNIWVMNADGTNRHPLTQYNVNPGTYVFVPTWSPDGSEIAFLSGGDLDGSGQPSTQWCIWTMKADGSGAAPLTATSTGPTWNTFWLQPAWQP